MSIEAFTCERPVVEIFSCQSVIGVISAQIFENFTLFYSLTGGCGLTEGMITKHRPWKTAMRESARRGRMKREGKV